MEDFHLVHEDKWKHLREKCYKNEEPEIKLMGYTVLDKDWVKKELGYEPKSEKEMSQVIPAQFARLSHASESKSFEEDKKLLKNLIEWGHHTPLESLQFIYEVHGITKSCMTQWDRQRIGIGWTQSSKRYINALDQNFVYNSYYYLDDEREAREQLKIDSEINEKAMLAYKQKLDLLNERLEKTPKELDGKQNPAYNEIKANIKQDSRKVIPTGVSTCCRMYFNLRSIRHFFNIRLSRHAEWEIRRLAQMVWLDVKQKFPETIADLEQKLYFK